MATLTSDEIADLITTTQRDLGEMKWTDLASTLQEYIALNEIMQKEKVKFESGTGIQFNVMKEDSGAARNTGLYEVDTYNVKDVMATGYVPWRHSNTNYAIERRELKMNSQPRRLVELVKVRRTDALLSWAKLCEDNFWSKPATSADELKPFGVFYWIVGNNTEGFNGGDPSGFSGGAAGLPTATYTRWKNWTAQYTAVTKPDLIAKMRKATVFTKFKPPVPIAQYNRGPQRRGIYTNYDVLNTMETLLEDQNDNLGNDVASKDSEVLFRKTPVKMAFSLEADLDYTDPVVGIDWSVFYPVFLEGEFMREEKNRVAPNQHSTFVTDVDTTMNYCCKDRRKCFIINK